MTLRVRLTLWLDTKMPHLAGEVQGFFLFFVGMWPKSTFAILNQYILYIVVVIWHLGGYWMTQLSRRPVCNTHRTIWKRKGNICIRYNSSVFFIVDPSFRMSVVTPPGMGRPQSKNLPFEPLFNYVKLCVSAMSHLHCVLNILRINAVDWACEWLLTRQTVYVRHCSFRKSCFGQHGAVQPPEDTEMLQPFIAVLGEGGRQGGEGVYNIHTSVPTSSQVNWDTLCTGFGPACITKESVPQFGRLRTHTGMGVGWGGCWTEVTACTWHGGLNKVSPGSVGYDYWWYHITTLSQPKKTSMPFLNRLENSPSPLNYQSGPRYSAFSAAGMCPLAWVLKAGVKSCW